MQYTKAAAFIRKTEPTVVNAIVAVICLGFVMVLATIAFFFFPDPPFNPDKKG